MERRNRLLTHLCAAAVLALAALLSAQIIDLYLTGNAARDAAGVLIAPIFTRENVTDRLMRIALPGGIALAVILAAAVLCRIKPAKAPRKRPAAIHPLPRLGLIRLGLYVLAAGLVLLGVINGGLRDVLVKAINICTECIGLG